jgi:hypothetical protein
MTINSSSISQEIMKPGRKKKKKKVTKHKQAITIALNSKRKRRKL